MEPHVIYPEEPALLSGSKALWDPPGPPPGSGHAFHCTHSPSTQGTHRHTVADNGGEGRAGQRSQTSETHNHSPTHADHGLGLAEINTEEETVKGETSM